MEGKCHGRLLSGLRTFVDREKQRADRKTEHVLRVLLCKQHLISVLTCLACVRNDFYADLFSVWQERFLC